MTDLPADKKGTGFRVSGRSGRKWFRVEQGSEEFDAWVEFYKRHGKTDLAQIIKRLGFSFVPGPSPKEFGAAQLMFLNSQLEGSA